MLGRPALQAIAPNGLRSRGWNRWPLKIDTNAREGEPIMPHFAKPPVVSPEGYDVDNAQAPGSLWRVRIPLKEKRTVVLCVGPDLTVKSNNAGVVPNEPDGKVKELPSFGDLRMFELFGLNVGGSFIDLWAPDGRFFGHLQALVEEKSAFSGSDRAVIMVPTQGSQGHPKYFLQAAEMLKAQVYNGKAIIVLATVKPGPEIELRTNRGESFSWGFVSNLSSMLVVSHGASGDGPNLAFGDGHLTDPLKQPLGSKDALAGPLSAFAESFWRSVGRALSSSGKIILLGCGEISYASKVAAVALHRVYGSSDKLGVADGGLSIRYAQAVEKGKLIPPMKSVGP
jgi:hypothetical protein